MLHLHRIILFGQPEATAETADVGVDREAGEREGDAAHNVGRLASDTGQGDQIVAFGRHFAAEAFDERSGHGNQVLRLGLEEAGGAHDVLQLGRVGRGEGGGARVAGEQFGRDHVDPRIGGLRREDRRHQQLERRLMIELAQRFGILGGETHRHLAGSAFRGARAGHRRRGYATIAVSLEWVPELRVHATPLDAADRTAILDLDARAAQRGATPLPDHVRAELTSAPQPGAVAVVHVDDDGTLRGAALAAPANDGAQVAVVVDGDDDTLRRTLLGALLTHTTGASVTWWATDSEPDRGLAGALGMRPGRTLLRMAAPLPLDLPEHTVATQPFRRGADDAEWLAVNNAAFSWHPEQGGWTQATLDQRLAEPWFDPDGFLLHHRNGRLAAFCWVKLHTADSEIVGEIYVIGVHPGAQGHGLGKALTVAGLRWMHEHGAGEAMLFVDGDNTTAIRLYEKLGFVVSSAQQAYTYQREDSA